MPPPPFINSPASSSVQIAFDARRNESVAMADLGLLLSWYAVSVSHPPLVDEYARALCPSHTLNPPPSPPHSTGDVRVERESRARPPAQKQPWWGRFLPSISKDGGRSWRRLLPWGGGKGEQGARVVFREGREEEWEEGGEGEGDGEGRLVVRGVPCLLRSRGGKNCTPRTLHTHTHTRPFWMDVCVLQRERIVSPAGCLVGGKAVLAPDYPADVVSSPGKRRAALLGGEREREECVWCGEGRRSLAWEGEREECVCVCARAYIPPHNPFISSTPQNTTRR